MVARWRAYVWSLAHSDTKGSRSLPLAPQAGAARCRPISITVRVSAKSTHISTQRNYSQLTTANYT